MAVEKMTANKLIREMKTISSSDFCRSRKLILSSFFKTAKGQYAEGDVFLGIEVPLTRTYAKQYQVLNKNEIKKLLDNKFHEVRLAALLILVIKYEQAKDRKEKREIVNFYLANSHRINNWDLVDLSVYKILGDFLLNESFKERRLILNNLVQSENLWERRMAIVSTFAFLKEGRKEETLFLVKKLLSDSQDLIHKASGWMLRELGKRVGQKDLESFLDVYAAKMPRVCLRYACEKFAPEKKKYYYNLGKSL